MTLQKPHVLQTLLDEKNPDWMRLEDLAQRLGEDEEKIRAALIELQDDELVFLRNGWYTASAVARQTFGRQPGLPNTI